MAKRTWKKAEQYKVYCVQYEDESFYIGRWSSNSKIKYENYFGSNKTELKVIAKQTIAEYTNATSAALHEALLQLKHKDNPKCLNKMVNIRIRLDHIKSDFPNFKIEI